MDNEIIDLISLKDLYNFILPFIKKGKSIKMGEIDLYLLKLNDFIEKKFNDFQTFIFENEKLSLRIKFLELYNTTIEILFLKLLNINPNVFYYICGLKEISDYINTNLNNNNINKPLSDDKIIIQAKDHFVLDKFQLDKLNEMKYLRNNSSSAHVFNEIIDISYFEFYMEFLEKIKNEKIDFAISDDNINLFIESISNDNFAENNELIKKQLLFLEQNNKKQDILNYCFSMLIESNNFRVTINKKILNFLLMNITNQKILEVFIKEIYNIINELEINSKSLIILEILNLIIISDLFNEYDYLYDSCKKIINDFQENEGKYYEFDNVNLLISYQGLLEFIFTKSQKNNYDFFINLYIWVLTRNPCGVAFDIHILENFFSRDKNLFLIIDEKMNKSYNSTSTWWDYRNSRINIKKFDLISGVKKNV